MRYLLIYIVAFYTINAAHAGTVFCDFSTVTKSEVQSSLTGNGTGIYYSRVYSSPSQFMRQIALSSGRHPFFYGVEGDFVGHYSRKVHHVFSQKFLGLVSYAGEVGDLLRGSGSPYYLVGADWAYSVDALPYREEKRAVSLEDLGMTALLMNGDEPDFVMGNGRDLRSVEKWVPLVTHIGQLKADESLHALKFQGALIITDEEEIISGNLDYLEEKDDVVQQRAFSLMQFYGQWWQSALDALSDAYFAPVSVQNGAELQLEPNQWRRSEVDVELKYKPKRGMAWSEESVHEIYAGELRFGVGGGYPIDILREGHYEIEASLSPFSKDVPLLMKKGKLLIKIGAVQSKMDILEGAQSIRLGLDLFAGKQLLEINHLEEANDKSFSLPYIRLTYKGARKSPYMKMGEN